MKKGFTMIELIFVIVILGILAAVAIPRLAATRDDAEVSKAATNVTTLISDIGSFYTSQGQFSADFAEMSNVALSDKKNGTLTNGKLTASPTGELAAAGKKCIKVTLVDQVADTGKVGEPVPAYLDIEQGTDAKASICGKILANPSVAKVLASEFSYKTIKTAKTSSKDAVYEDKTMKKEGHGYVPVSGLSVVF